MVDTSSRSENIPIDFYTSNRIIKWQVDASRIRKWYGTLDRPTRESVAAAIDLLSEQGPNLKRPFVGEVQSSRFPNKQGRWRKWYQRAVPQADRLYQEHLDSLNKEAR